MVCAGHLHVVRMTESNANRNRIAIFDLIWFSPVAVLATLECYGRLPSLPGTLVPISALAALFLAIGALVILRHLSQRFPCSAADMSGFALWLVVVIDVCVILFAFVAPFWLLWT